ncbi:unnamed protein product [Onchocerca flexuosa]|uniref:Uncharacterized protein n=1 Tax=Onchocerca flexuosa TaxID=387005 RepID=A0A183I1U4_9BILA|nr:unnamed protein product [Onchocerca flexuosa]
MVEQYDEKDRKRSGLMVDIYYVLSWGGMGLGFGSRPIGTTADDSHRPISRHKPEEEKRETDGERKEQGFDM